ncbi:MAG: ankyrin repeat domain-containing protein [Halobacteriaceae archaeon]
MRVLKHLLRLLHGGEMVDAWGEHDLACLHVMSCTSGMTVYLQDACQGKIVDRKTCDIGTCALSAMYVSLRDDEFSAEAWIGFMIRHFYESEDANRRRIYFDLLNGRGHDAPLTNAIDRKRPRIAHRILKMPGVDVNACDAKGRTRLVHAIYERQENIALHILDFPGVDVNARNTDPEATPFAFLPSVLMKLPKVALRVLDLWRADVRARDANQYSIRAALKYIIIHPVLREHLDVARRILDFPGIDVNATIDDVDQRTVVIDAIIANLPGVALRILDVPGVDVNVRNSKGLTALMYACTMNQPDVARRIMESPGVDIHDPEQDPVLRHIIG